MSQILNASGEEYARPRRGDWIKTYSGRQVWPLDFRPEDLVVGDIAHALSNLCRFNGHCRVFYSVAEHSFHVAHEVSRRLRSSPEYDELSQHDRLGIVLQALVHDASEAYLGDLVRPIKHCADFATLRAADQELQARIHAALGLPEALHPLIERVDDEILVIEGELLLGGTKGWSNLPQVDLQFQPQLRGVAPHVMKEEFGKFYRSLRQQWNKTTLRLT